MFLQNVISGKTRLAGGAGISFGEGFDTEDPAFIYLYRKLDFQNYEAVR